MGSLFDRYGAGDVPVPPGDTERVFRTDAASAAVQREVAARAGGRVTEGTRVTHLVHRVRHTRGTIGWPAADGALLGGR